MWWPLSTAPGQADTRQVMTCGCAASMASRARVEWAKAPPARISAATQIASMISSGVLPLRMASLVWPLMQYGHWVTCATATAMSCLAVSYTHLRAHETDSYLVCRLLLEKKKIIHNLQR